MVMQSHNQRRDTLGRALPTENSDKLSDARISGERDSLRRGIALRFDYRKGAELLNDRNFGKGKSNGHAPLDGKRFNPDQEIKKSEKTQGRSGLDHGVQSMGSHGRDESAAQSTKRQTVKTIHRFDDRKGTELLNDRNFGSGKPSREPSLDGMRPAAGLKRSQTPLPTPIVAPLTLVTLPTFEPPRVSAVPVTPLPQFKVVDPPVGVPVTPPPQLPAGLKVVSPPTIAPPVPPPASPGASSALQPSAELTPTMQDLVKVVNTSTLDRRSGSPRNNPVLRLSDHDREALTTMLTDPVVKNQLLSYSDTQLKGAFEAVRPDRIKYLEEWLSEKHREAVNYPGIALSVAGITSADTNRIGHVVEIAREVARQKVTY